VQPDHETAVTSGVGVIGGAMLRGEQVIA